MTPTVTPDVRLLAALMLHGDGDTAGAKQLLTAPAAPPDPAPVQPELSAQQQRFIDAQNYDQIAEAVENGHKLTADEAATWQALAKRLGKPDPTTAAAAS